MASLLQRTPKRGLPSPMHDKANRLKVISASSRQNKAYFYEICEQKSPSTNRSLVTVIIYGFRPCMPQSFFVLRELVFSVPSTEKHLISCRLDESDAKQFGHIEIQRVINSRLSNHVSSSVKINRISVTGRSLCPAFKGQLPFKIEKKISGQYFAQCAHGQVYADGSMQRIRKISINGRNGRIEDSGLLVDLVRVVREACPDFESSVFSYQLSNDTALVNIQEKKTLVVYSFSQKSVQHIIDSKRCAHRWTIVAGDHNFWATKSHDDGIYRVTFPSGKLQMNYVTRRPSSVTKTASGHDSVCVINNVWLEVCDISSVKSLKLGCLQAKWRKESRQALVFAPIEVLSLKQLALKSVHRLFGAKEKIPGEWKGGVSSQTLHLLTGFDVNS